METKDQNPRHEDADTVKQAQGGDRVSRRRALIAGLAAAPVVLSLMNRSAWGGEQVSCTLVASYVNAGYKWQSPRPSNLEGQLPISQGDISRCGFNNPR